MATQILDRHLHIKAIDAFIDPSVPRERAIITHGHADHARSGHGAVLATPDTIAIMKTRYGEDCAGQFQALEFGEPLAIDDVTITFFPAGHVLGSAQVLIEHRGQRVVVTGDYKRLADRTSQPFELAKCDLLVTEATFGLPVFQHPHPQLEIRRLLKSVADNPERSHLVGAYALGKAQRVIGLLCDAGWNAPIYLHGAMIRLCELYQELGVDLGDLRPATGTTKAEMAGQIVIAPPSAIRDRWSRRFPDPVVCQASGWMSVKQRARQALVELPLVISDHCDWGELLQTIGDTEAKTVWVTHGREDALVYWCRRQGLEAEPLNIQGFEDDGGEGRGMKGFAQLLELLALTPSRNRKLAALTQYFRETPDPDRGYALAVLTGALTFRNVKPALLKDIVLREVDETLFAMSYDYVGDLGETIALIWPHHGETGDLPSLTDLIELFNTTSKSDLPKLIAALLTRAEINERWALVKLATGALRIGVSARLAKTALSEMSGKDLQEIEEVWHGLKVPYLDLFAWLDGAAERPDIDHAARFHPLMLSNPIDEEKDLGKLDPKDFSAEWKWDGIRVQLVMGEGTASLFSRTGDDIANAFPDIVENVSGQAVLDGELLVGKNFEAASFNDLQQRLNKKVASAKHLKDSPAFIRVYDMLFDGREDIRTLPWTERRKRLEAWLQANPQTRLDISEILPFSDWDDLAQQRRQGADEHGHEGVMLKLRTSHYVPGRPKGYWFKWKRDPNVVDAVLMYAQRGHGKRSSFYSDYTFGVWKGNEIVPIGKAYFGFTDEELKMLDKWIRANTIQAFGPVREVKKELVFEVAFDSAQESARHKSGVALRFPRINRIRWDKPATEAGTLEDMAVFIAAS